MARCRPKEKKEHVPQISQNLEREKQDLRRQLSLKAEGQLLIMSPDPGEAHIIREGI